MDVWIQVAAGSNQRRVYNEKTLEFLGTREASEIYPYPYGFILDTDAADGDNLDCYVLTRQPVAAGSIQVCDPIGILEQIEDGAPDDKVIAVLRGAAEAIDEQDAIAQLRDFIIRLFSHHPEMHVKIGRYLDRRTAEARVAAAARPSV